MSKGGFGKGWGNGPYHSQNQLNGGGANWQYNWQNGFGKSSSGGLGMTTMAGNFTNFKGGFYASGKVSCSGSAQSKIDKSQQCSDTCDAQMPASQNNGFATAIESNKDALLQKTEKVVDTMSSKIAPRPDSSNGPASVSKGDIDAEKFEAMLGNSKMFSQVQTDVGQVKNEIQSINDNMASILNVQQQGFCRIESMLASMSSGQGRLNAMGFLTDIPAAMAITDGTPEHHTPPFHALGVENHSKPFVLEGADAGWTAFDQLVDDGLVEQELAEAKRLGQELALDSEDEKDRKEQAELDEILIREAQLTEDAVSLPFVGATIQDLGNASFVLDP